MTNIVDMNQYKNSLKSRQLKIHELTVKLSEQYKEFLVGVHKRDLDSVNSAVSWMRQISQSLIDLNVQITASLPDREATQEDIERVDESIYRHMLKGLIEIERATAITRKAAGLDN